MKGSSKKSGAGDGNIIDKDGILVAKTILPVPEPDPHGLASPWGEVV
jgi:hypothetical protein